MFPSIVVVGYRAQQPEVVHRASWVVCNALGQVVDQSPQAYEQPTFMRSAQKPFQAMATAQLITTPLLPEQLAIMAGSHGGTPTHTALVQQLLQQANSTVEQLHCAAAWPSLASARNHLKQQQQGKSPLYHNCSGKHAGMVLACVQQHWPVDTYFSPQHPLQQYQQQQLQTLMQTPFTLAVDGCGLPVASCTLGQLAWLYAQLVSGQQPTLDRIAQAMMAHPEIVGDNERIDTLLMQVTAKGSLPLLAKVGAEGLLTVACPALQQGFAFKLWDGNNTVRNMIAPLVLQQLGWLSNAQYDALMVANKTFLPLRYNDAGVVVGEYQLV